MKHKVLIIEDERGPFFTVKGLIEEFFNNYHLIDNEKILGCGKVTVDTKEAALKLIREGNPDIVLTDINLGNVSAFDIIKAINEPKFFTIFFTGFDGYGDEAWKMHHRYKRMTFHKKPFNIMTLKDAIEEYKSYISSSISFRISKGKKIFKLNQIIKFKAKNGIVRLWLKNSNEGVEKFSLIEENISQLDSKLPSKLFCKINQYCIINRSFIDEISGLARNKRVYLRHCAQARSSIYQGEKVSQAYEKGFNEWYKNFNT